MLTTLSISNYALIKELQTNFTNGLSIITGETGAGKSIVLGALGLVMGNRADLNSLKDATKKCVIEATFSVDDYSLKNFFAEEDLDYEELTIIRREILASGKSRAFVNDTPVRLSVLNVLKEKLIDVHSQHKTAQLSETSYQFQILDALAGNFELLEKYTEELKVYKVVQKELQVLLKEQEAAKQEYAYNSHLFQELVEANLKLDEQETLEETLDKLNNSELISAALLESLNLATEEQMGLQATLNQIKSSLDRISGFSIEFESYSSRIESLKIELDDVVFEIEKSIENVDINPDEIDRLNERLQLIYNLQKKHMVSSITELLRVQQALEVKVAQVENATELLEEKELAIAKIVEKLNTISSKIHENRKQSVPKLTNQLEQVLSELGMTNATFKIDLQKGKLSSHRPSVAMAPGL